MSDKFVPYHLCDINNTPAHLDDNQKSNWISAAKKGEEKLSISTIEIYPAIVYQWFEWSIKTSVVNLQLKFADCPYRPNEPWALQQALLYTYGMFIDKSITVNNGQRN
ncbi:unnamed protein product [Rotaria sordida]|uniref:Uncharacterized protein n=2 Tax=Rotaria sordida TaxID=392033 RepID=A0A819S5U2_9BILA|nr:unnamed protein product [Rotaria sordida]